MVPYNITYQARNQYQEEVLEAIYDIMVIPLSDSQQQLMNYTLENSLDEEPFLFKNKFGFDIIRLRAVKVFQDFEFKAEFQVEIHGGIADDLFLKPDQYHDPRFDREFRIDHHLYLYQSPFTQISPDHADQIFSYRDDLTPLEYGQELNKYIHDLLTYVPDSTDVQTKAEEVLNIKSGVCQDYVHVYLGVARQNHFPCRYVSGYLNQGKDLIGAAKMHAWAELLVPGKGWIGFDPTNNLMVDHNYIKVAHGVDYRDCSPIRGVLRTNGPNTTSHQVKVAVPEQ